MKNKVALVTGGGSGMGRAAALEFAKKGAAVAVTDISVKNGKETVNIINNSNKAVFLKCDVSKASEVKAMIEKVIATYGRLDYAFNNAGIEGVAEPIIDLDEQTWSRVISINLTGVVLCMKYEIPHMIKQGGGAIINNSSVGGIRGFPNHSAYVAAKHGVVGLSKTAALEYGMNNIRVNAICPGAIHTPMLDRHMENIPGLREIYMSQPMGRIADASEIGKTVVWLCSEEASFITGQAIAIDGGWTAK